jgi:hypothetical protein
MKKRGKVLRDTNMGNGLLVVDGKQYPFTLEDMWQSEHAPRVGMAVEVDFSGDDIIGAVVPLPETQLAREQAEQAMISAKAKGSELASGVVARFGLPTLGAVAALMVAWIFLNTISVQVAPGYKVGLTFWKLLAVLNSPAGVLAGFNGAPDGAGLYGFLAAVALIAPLAPQFWKDRRAHLGGLMPLAFMLLVAVVAYSGISAGMSEAQGAAGTFGGRAAAEMAQAMQSEMARQAMRAVSLGAGFYLAAAASLYFAAKGTIKFLAHAQ